MGCRECDLGNTQLKWLTTVLRSMTKLSGGPFCKGLARWFLCTVGGIHSPSPLLLEGS